MNPQIKQLHQQISKVILGKDEQITLALSCFFAQGHLLIEDIPGIGKTTLAKVMAQSLGLDFCRVQCTNDMLPGDILGVSMYDQNKNSLVFHQGPVFTQVLLSDEINRATPKTQSALLEAMEERQVSIDGKTYPLKKPFFVIGTQNPQEQAGTYPLPESQLDRFLMRISLGYPEREFEIALLHQGGARNMAVNVQSVLNVEQVLELQAKVQEIFVSESLFAYIHNILDYSRKSGVFQFGLSPRAGLSLTQCARAYSLLMGREHVIPEDLQYVLPYVVSHRLRSRKNGLQFSIPELKEIFNQVELPK